MNLNRAHFRQTLTTVRAFRNWPSVLLQIAASSAGQPRQTIWATTRRGNTIWCPMSARSALFTVYGEDVLGLDSVDDVLMSVRDRTPLIVDVGAHAGTFTMLVAERYPTARIICMEPAEATANYLRWNVKAGKLQDRIEVRQQAMGAETGRANLFEPRPGSLGSSLLDSRVTSSAASSQVQVVSFDDVAAEIDGPIDLLKLNCEGAEFDIVEHSSSDSWAKVRSLILEYHPIPGKSWNTIRSQLHELGYTLRRRVEQREDMGIATFVRVGASNTGEPTI